MPRAIDNMTGGGPLGKHIDAYQEYTELVGRLDGGRPLPDAQYQELRRRAANPNRRLYVNWRNKETGLDCRAIGPQSMCLCQHRYNEHDWDAFETKAVRCKMPGCSCTCFNYVPVRGSQDLRCSSCHRSWREHRPQDHGCPSAGTKFASSYTCSCTGTYMQHETVFESRAERARDGRPLDAGWMEQAAREGLPVCHLGGIMGFSSLADGVDRAYAGLERESDSAAAAAQGAVFDMGANRFMDRMQLEDEVNSVAALHGKAAGMKALAAVQAKRRGHPPPPRAVGAPRTSRDSQRGVGGRSSPALSAPPAPIRGNVHTLGGPLPGAGASAVSSGNRPAAKAAVAAASPAAAAAGRPRAASAASSPKVRGGTGAAGRKLGGVRKATAEDMRQARLARLDG